MHVLRLSKFLNFNICTLFSKSFSYCGFLLLPALPPSDTAGCPTVRIIVITPRFYLNEVILLLISTVCSGLRLLHLALEFSRTLRTRVV